MKSTGIVRGVDYAGRVILPQSICSGLGIKRGEDSLEMFLDGNSLVMKSIIPAVFSAEVWMIFPIIAA